MDQGEFEDLRRRVSDMAQNISEIGRELHNVTGQVARLTGMVDRMSAIMSDTLLTQERQAVAAQNIERLHSDFKAAKNHCDKIDMEVQALQIKMGSLIWAVRIFGAAALAGFAGALFDVIKLTGHS